MPGWTWENIAIRNREVFGAPEPATPVEDRKAQNAPEALIELECTRFLQADGWRELRTNPLSDRGRGAGFGEVGMCDHLYMRPRVMGLDLSLLHSHDILWCVRHIPL